MGSTIASIRKSISKTTMHVFHIKNNFSVLLHRHLRSRIVKRSSQYQHGSIYERQNEELMNDPQKYKILRDNVFGLTRYKSFAIII